MKEKRLDFEILRILAIVLVVFNHTQQRGFELYRVPDGGAVNVIGSLLLGVTCKIAVPLFLMVSGGLLLDREESIGQVLKKRVLRIFAALVLFSGVLYGFWIHWGTVEAPGILNFLHYLWSYGISTPYWYLYGYMGLMLMLPFLRSMVKTMTNRSFLYLLLLYVAVQSLEMLGMYTGVGTIYGTATVPGSYTFMNVFLPVGEQMLFYFLMGYYFACRFPWERLRGKHFALLSGLSVLAICLMAGLTWGYFQKNPESGLVFTGSLLCVPVFTVYMLVRYFVEKHPVKKVWRTVLTQVGGCTFGAYLLEGILRHELMPVYTMLEPKIHVLPACLVWVVAVVVCGLFLTWWLKKIPVLRRIL